VLFADKGRGAGERTLAGCYTEGVATVTFDTLKFVERLKAAGIPEAQAKAFAEALDSSLASHSDLERIERKLIEHDGEFKLIKFMLGMLIGGVVALVLKSFF
jgi:hypothetical protein